MAFAHAAVEMGVDWLDAATDAASTAPRADHGRPEWGSPARAASDPRGDAAAPRRHVVSPGMATKDSLGTAVGPTICGATKVDKDTCLVCQNAELYAEQTPHN